MGRIRWQEVVDRLLWLEENQQSLDVDEHHGAFCENNARIIDRWIGGR